jgi:Tfp pilus assembly protein PilV
MSCRTKQFGFTLIEAIIYVGIAAFILTSTLGIVYRILENSQSVTVKNTGEEEAVFILGKLNWALTGATSISQPALNATSSVLQLNRISVGTSLKFSTTTTNLFLERGAGPKQLNADGVSVQNFSVHRTSGTPEYIDVYLTVNEQQYNLRKFLRQ